MRGKERFIDFNRVDRTAAAYMSFSEAVTILMLHLVDGGNLPLTAAVAATLFFPGAVVAREMGRINKSWTQKK